MGVPFLGFRVAYKPNLSLLQSHCPKIYFSCRVGSGRVGLAGLVGWLDNLEIRLYSAQLELELG